MGCNLLPDVAHQPIVHNPFPQLGRVAVAPFFNLSNEETVDGEQFTNAYFTELQSVPGFEVIPPNIVTEAIIKHQLSLNSPADARRLAQILGVDAVVIGAVTDYPPRIGLKVDWFAANPGFHAIPPGYGLPWGTAEEEFIPSPLVFEAEFALAQAQLKTQTPRKDPPTEELPPPAVGLDGRPGAQPPLDALEGEMGQDASEAEILSVSDGEEPLSPEEEIAPGQLEPTVVADGAIAPHGVDLPENWPDERAFIPPPPAAHPPKSKPYNGPVMTHTKIYSGNDSAVTEALASYAYFRDDARRRRTKRGLAVVSQAERRLYSILLPHAHL